MSKLKKDILNLGRQHVVVGILDDKKANKIDWSKGSRIVAGKETRYIKRGGRSRNESLKSVIKKIDAKTGLLSNALKNAKNKDLISITKKFAEMDKTEKDIKRLSNACRAIVRNQIQRNELGNNSKEYAKKKGFSRYGYATGTMFKNIKAKYYDKK